MAAAANATGPPPRKSLVRSPRRGNSPKGLSFGGPKYAGFRTHREGNLSSPSRRLGRWLKVTGIIYALGAADYVARPRAAIAGLNSLGGEPLEPEDRGLYNSLAGAYMATIAALALSAARDPADRAALVPPLLVAKTASAGLLLFQYVETRRRGFAIAAGLDAFLLGVTAGLYSALD